MTICCIFGHNLDPQSTTELLNFDLKTENSYQNMQRRALATTSTSSKGDFSECRCDLTTNTCDAYCCCDDDCNDDIIIRWEKVEKSCIYEGTNEDALSADQCYDRAVVGNVADLQFGLRIYTNSLRSFL
jgi:hypothetical protein